MFYRCNNPNSIVTDMFIGKSCIELYGKFISEDSILYGTSLILSIYDILIRTKTKSFDDYYKDRHNYNIVRSDDNNTVKYVQLDNGYPLLVMFIVHLNPFPEDNMFLSLGPTWNVPELYNWCNNRIRKPYYIPSSIVWKFMQGMGYS